MVVSVSVSLPGIGTAKSTRTWASAVLRPVSPLVANSSWASRSTLARASSWLLPLRAMLLVSAVIAVANGMGAPNKITEFFASAAVRSTFGTPVLLNPDHKRMLPASMLASSSVMVWDGRFSAVAPI